MARMMRLTCWALALAAANCVVVVPPGTEEGDDTKVTVAPQVGRFSSPDGLVVFDVSSPAAGGKVLAFRGTTATITDGRFAVQKGQINGTDCPTDGFLLQGTFVSEARAEGTLTPITACTPGTPSAWFAVFVPGGQTNGSAGGTPPDCASLAAGFRQAASMTIEAESGETDGRIMPRDNSSSDQTVALGKGQKTTVNLVLTEAAQIRLVCPYSDDGADGDILSVTVAGHTQNFTLHDTRGNGQTPGAGWNEFCVPAADPDAISLGAGSWPVTLQMVQADAQGAEIDCVLVFATATPPSPPKTWNLSVRAVPPAGIAISGSSTAISGTTDYSTVVNDGTPVVLTAPLDSGGTPARLFDHWILDGIAQPTAAISLSFTVDQDHVAEAVYGAYIAHSVDELRALIAQAEPGASIYVPPGRYVAKASIEIARDDLTILGAGKQTVFALAEGTRCPVLIVGEPTPFAPTITHHGITIRSIAVEGYRAPNPTPQDELCSVPGREYLRNNGVTIRQAEDILIEDVLVTNAASGGIVLEQRCRRILLKGSRSRGHRYDGIAWDGDIQNCTVDSCTLEDNDGAGISFDIGPAFNRIANSLIQNNKAVGIFIRDSQSNCFVSNTIDHNGQDAVFIADGDNPGAAATDNAFVNNQYTNNGRNGIWQAGQRSAANCETGGTFSGNTSVDKLESFPAEAPLLVCGSQNACNR